MRKQRKIPRVEVTWDDSTSLNYGWLSLDEYLERRQPARCTSVGYLVYRDRRSLVLMMSQADNDDVSDGLTIPVACVRRVQHLR